ncbi:MAG: class I SAM-dependent methyltransferase [Rubritalea sp.]|jgi:SAM-dependent methyltransferase|tara:strand:- start:1046 stop:1702 length:657 start_codon:yes stop_codon:yes gene_type:complete
MKTIDENKIKQYQQLHKDDPSYGSTSLKFIDEVSLMINALKPKSILDYGCGKGTLIAEIERRYPEINCYRYDPSIQEYSALPVKDADLVINTDVLEHIPVADIDSVLREISSISKNAYFNLHHGKAATTLPSGENAHCTVKSPSWYSKKIATYFDPVELLPGRRYITRVAITFSIQNSDRKKYLDIVSRNKIHSPFSLRLRFFVKNILRDYFGVTINK